MHPPSLCFFASFFFPFFYLYFSICLFSISYIASFYFQAASCMRISLYVARSDSPCGTFISHPIFTLVFSTLIFASNQNKYLSQIFLPFLVAFFSLQCCFFLFLQPFDFFYYELHCFGSPFSLLCIFGADLAIANTGFSPSDIPCGNPCPISPHTEAVGTLPPLQDIQNVRLYHLEQDPCEKTDLSALFPHRVRRLLDRMEEHFQTAVDPWWPDQDPAACPNNNNGTWGPWLDD